MLFDLVSLTGSSSAIHYIYLDLNDIKIMYVSKYALPRELFLVKFLSDILLDRRFFNDDF